jgi:hypothetical protein
MVQTSVLAGGELPLTRNLHASAPIPTSPRKRSEVNWRVERVF